MKRKRRYESEDESSSSDTSSSSSSSTSSTASKHVERQQQPRQDPIENCLGVDPTQINTLGPEISENIAVRWNSYLSTGLDRETKIKLMEKYKIPQNCKIVGGTKLNDEVEAKWTPLVLKKDNFLLELQNLIGKGLVAIEKVLSNLIEKKREGSHRKGRQPDADLVGLAEAGQIICLAHNTLSKHRQLQLSGHFNDKIKKLVSLQTIDLFLFGQDFGDKWKNAKALQTTAREPRQPNLRLQRKPVQFGNTVVTKCTKEMHKLYTKCIQRLQDIGAVKAVNSCQDQFLSSYFLRQKDNGEFRFILNLKKLNEFIYFATTF
nr:unnamed protein product [Callosobruchus chinensis]